MRQILVVGTFLSCVSAALAAEKPAKRPPFPQITAAVGTLFAGQTDYRPGDLISRSQAEMALRKLAAIGFEPANAKDILAGVTADDGFLVTALRTPAGKAFMRKIARYPGGYDRLDRLSRMPHGRQTVEDLIRGPGGEEMIRYLTTSNGGRNLGKQLSHDASGADFNKPTGRIYTVDALLTALKQTYDAPTSTGGRP
jgi:hypothetical protein